MSTKKTLPDSVPLKGTRCSQQVFGRIGANSGPCTRGAVVTCDGKHFCKQHSPTAAGERRAERDAESARSADLSHSFWRLDGLRKSAGLYALTEAEIETVIAMGGIRAVIAKATTTETAK